MQVVEHTSENDDYDFGSPTVNQALKDVIKARNMLGRHHRLSGQLFQQLDTAPRPEDLGLNSQTPLTGNQSLGSLPQLS